MKGSEMSEPKTTLDLANIWRSGQATTVGWASGNKTSAAVAAGRALASIDADSPEQIAALKADLAANASMLARQTDLAREAENERDAARALSEVLAGALYSARCCTPPILRVEADKALTAYEESK